MTADRDVFCEINGLRTHFREAGRGPKVVVLLHGGGPGNSAMFTWGSIFLGLSDRFRVIGLDLPGYGQSDYLPSGIGSVDFASHVADFLDELALEDVAIIGHSMGGASRVPAYPAEAE